MNIDPPPAAPSPSAADVRADVRADDVADARTAARSRVRPRRRRGLPALIALLSVAALAAGVLTRMVIGLPPRQPGRATGQLPEAVVVDGLAARAEAAALEHVVLQLELPNECPWPDCTVPWGHVPEFTLLDDGRVVYMDMDPAHPAPLPVVHVSTVPADEIARLTEQIDGLIGDRAAPLTDGSPCPAASGCPDARSVVRVRRAGALRTFVVNGAGSSASESDLDGAVTLLRDWFSEPNTNLPETIVAMMSDTPDPWSDDQLPPIWVGADVTSMPKSFDRSALDALALSWYRASNRLPAPSPGAIDDVGGSESPGVPAFDGVDPASRSRPQGWTFRTGTLDDPAADGTEQRMIVTHRLVFVPWIYPDVDVAAMLDVYREAGRNAVAARAAADATALAMVPDAVAGSATPEPAVLIPYPTPFPTALAVTWTDDGRPQLPSARGIQTWMEWFKYDVDHDAIQRLRAAGFEWFKQRFAWTDMQLSPDLHFDWSHSDPYIATVQEFGGQVMVQLAAPPTWAVESREDGVPFNLEAWSIFVQSFAGRYRGQVAAYEIMNEPNLAREWGGPPDPAAYARILGAAYDAIKLVDPKAVVVTAGLAPTGDRMPEAMGDVAFVRAMLASIGGYDNGEQGTWPVGFYDAIGVHAAGFKAAPDVAPEEAAASAELGGDRTFTFRRIEDIWSEYDREGVRPAPFVITEFGWTTDPRPDSPYHWMAVDPATRGAHIAQAFDLAPTLPGIGAHLGPMILFSAADRAWTPDDEAYWWAVADADGNVDGAVMEALGSGGGPD
ncbi:MAG: cellulase family glycosylhydrolase [Ardenticatenales bacterium]